MIGGRCSGGGGPEPTGATAPSGAEPAGGARAPVGGAEDQRELDEELALLATFLGLTRTQIHQ